MKNSEFRFVKILCLTCAVCTIAFLATALAGEAPQTPTNAVKEIRTVQKNPALAAKQRAAAIHGKRNYLGVSAGVQKNLHPYTAKGGVKTGLRTQRIPTPASLLPYRASQKRSIPGLRSDLRVPGSKANSAVPFNSELMANASHERVLQSGSNPESNAGAPSASDGRKAEPESSESAQIILVLVALCAAFGGTAVILYLISKRSPRKDEMRTAARSLGHETQPQETAPMSIETRPTDKPGASSQAEEITEEEDAVVELAQRYRRGQGEMQLIFSMQAHENDEAPLANLLQASTRSKAKGNTKRLAKKFGLRKNEVDLLLRLQKCSDSANHSLRIL